MIRAAAAPIVIYMACKLRRRLAAFTVCLEAFCFFGVAVGRGLRWSPVNPFIAGHRATVTRGERHVNFAARQFTGSLAHMSMARLASRGQTREEMSK